MGWERARAGLGVIFVAAACGPSRGCNVERSGAWVDERAAVVRCTQAGRERMPPVLADLPVPDLPSGLLARALDPMSLDELGYERDQVACATLETPEPAVLEAVADDIPRLAASYDATSTAVVRAGGRCACDIAHAMGFRDLIAVCHRTPTIATCRDAAPSEEMHAAVEPLLEVIADVELPLVHWRLAGRTDRPGWFAEHLDRAIAKHPGGSTAYRRGQAVPARDNYVLLRELLKHEHVVAVVRQDGGRALLVAREIGKMLVLDHFAYVPTSPEYEPLLTWLDNAHVERYVERLAAPSERKQLGLDSRDGYLAEIDRERLEEVDALLVAASSLSGARYDPSAERRIVPDVLVDRATIQAPFGTQGEALVVRLQLSDRGQIWAQTLGSEVLSPTLDELGLAGEGPELVQPPGRQLPFHLRGTETEAVLIHGLHQLPPILRAIEMATPMTIQGRADAWRFDLPAGDPFAQEETPVFRGLRGLLAERPYHLHAELDAARTSLRLELRPR